jgi:hypothetical protein
MESHQSLHAFETQADRYEDWFERHAEVYYQRNRAGNPFYQHARFHPVEEVAGMLSRAGFIGLDFYQTLLGWQDGAAVYEPVRPGHGQGGFVVVRGRKPAKASRAGETSGNR